MSRLTAALAVALAMGSAWLSGCTRPASNGDTLVIAVESAPKSMDPRLGYVDGVAARIHQIVFDTLVRKNERFEIVPYLAESFEQSPDGKTFTFKLRPGVKFHNGQELTSEDVKYTYDSIRGPNSKSPARAAFDRLESIETPDPLTVIFRAREPYNILGDLIAIPIIARGTDETQADNPVGTGPFKVVAHDDQSVDLEANPDYFQGAPRVKKIRVKVVAENSTRESLLENGETDLAINTGFSPDTVTKMKVNPDLQVVIANGTNIDHIGINTNNEVLRTAAVRQAVAHSIDRDTIINTLYQGQARPANAIMPPESWAYEPGVTVYPFDVAKAKALLDGAGFPDPDGDGPATRFEITFTTSNSGLAPSIAQIVQEQLKKVGIGVKLEQFERNTFFEKLNQGAFALYYARSVGSNQSPDVFAWAYHSRYTDKDLDAAATKVKAATDPTAVAADMATMLEVIGRKAYCPSAEVDRLVAEARSADAATKRADLLRAYDLLATRGAGNRGKYCNPALNELVEHAEATTDREEQKKLYSEIQMTVSREVPQIYLWYPANVVVATRRVGNIAIDPSGAWYFIKDVTLDSGQ